MHTKDEILDALESLKLTRHAKVLPTQRTRELMITPFPGARGAAGVVIALNGTPPHALVVMVPSGSTDAEGARPRLVNIDSDRARTVPASTRPPTSSSYSSPSR